MKRPHACADNDSHAGVVQLRLFAHRNDWSARAALHGQVYIDSMYFFKLKNHEIIFLYYYFFLFFVLFRLPLMAPTVEAGTAPRVSDWPHGPIRHRCLGISM